MSLISSQEVVDANAKIGAHVRIGPYTVIGPNVEIGDHCDIGAHVIIHSNTIIGKNNHIHSFAALGGDPQDLTYAGEETWLVIGDHNIIREYVSIHRGSVKENKKTIIGNHNCFLAYSHVAHDCVVGDHTLFINNATLGGHVVLNDHVIIGAFVAVHQFCRIGAYSFIAQAAQVSQDVPPYVMVAGTPSRPCGLNVIGLRRHGFDRQVIRALKEATIILYNREYLLADALAQLEDLAVKTPQILPIIDFVRSSKRGISRKIAQAGVSK